MSDPLRDAKDRLSLEVYGMTALEAVKKGICISCHKDIAPLLKTANDANEYHITGLCPTCFKEACGDEELDLDS